MFQNPVFQAFVTSVLVSVPAIVLSLAALIKAIKGQKDLEEHKANGKPDNLDLMKGAIAEAYLQGVQHGRWKQAEAIQREVNEP